MIVCSIILEFFLNIFEMHFYKDLIDDGVIGEFGNDETGGRELGDLIKVGGKNA
jgi:hypothetical protein